MNQIDYQPAAFNPALAFSPQQSQIHSHGGLQQPPFQSRNTSVGPQAFGQAPYPSQGSPNQHSSHQNAGNAGRGFGLASTGFNPNASAMMQQQQQQQQQHQLSCKCFARLPSPIKYGVVSCDTVSTLSTIGLVSADPVLTYSPPQPSINLTQARPSLGL